MTIHRTEYRPDTCTCIIEYSWDDTVPPSSRTHTLTNYILRCPEHSPLATDSERFNTIFEENPRKNIAWQSLLDNGPAAMTDIQENGTKVLKRGITITWTWTGTAPNRVLTLTVTGFTLTTNQLNTAQNWLDNRFGVGRVIVAQG